MSLFLILHNIRSAHNVGSLFRTADGAGVSKIYITGFTPTPIDRFGRKDARIAKVSLGAEETVVWEERALDELLVDLRKQGIQVVALEQDERSTPYDSFTPTASTALLLGSEVGGVDMALLDTVDTIIEIPMQGKKDSLNVSVAGAIALFEIAKKTIGR